ncbi:DnaJ domain-containing protein [Wenzhouxiangella sp. AB-CW3]|uniref:DnaJ C-terminal domain-containing protein n=1 Tax=Wenzhouxiangella sp. AB-CW3 TaxID=2771012 RepID=UPI00168AD642|nr:DnaJ C-terminal domain-containing protein [Wenzhouxiangella sp. AB-CW3]QOC21623.1 DnaJ domain-containing protein [Wenzhouxiangella sp. AB-CW3]
MKFKDYYRTLGVEPGASADEIKRAYRKLARKYHPDRNKETGSEDRFKEIGEAWEVLKDPDKRRQYDQLRAGGWRQGDEFEPPPGWGGGFRRSDGDGLGGFSNFSEFFENLFGGGFSARRGRAPRARGRDLRTRVQIDLETAYSGGRRRITIDPAGPGGEGLRDARTRSLDVNIPAGVTPGQQVRLAGQGEPGGNGGRRGDLFLEIDILPHPLFELDGRDIQLTLPIAPWEAALGARVNVPTLGGRVAMNIPAGSSSGKRLRLKGRGLPGQPPGDQLVTLKVVVPRATTERQKELYRELEKEQQFNPRSELSVTA